MAHGGSKPDMGRMSLEDHALKKSEIPWETRESHFISRLVSCSRNVTCNSDGDCCVQPATILTNMPLNARPLNMNGNVYNAIQRHRVPCYVPFHWKPVGFLVTCLELRFIRQSPSTIIGSVIGETPIFRPSRV